VEGIVNDATDDEPSRIDGRPGKTGAPETARALHH
jgi:hypothetical protein